MRIIEIKAKTIINRMNDGFFAMRYLPFRLTVNIYRGCTHGCPYCYAARTHYYMRSTPDRFSESVYVKVNAAELFEREISKRKKRGKLSVIVIGNISDTYQPIETKYRLTRRLLEIAYENEVPVFIETKSPLILNDIDVLEKLARKGLIGVGMTVTSYDNDFAKLVEPFIPRHPLARSTIRPKERILTLGRLSQIDVDTYLHITPYFPAITDKYIEEMIKDAADVGVGNIIMATLELSAFIWNRLKPIFLSSGKYAYLVPLYERLYYEEGRKLGGRITTSEREHYALEEKVSALCRKYGIGYWAFTNPQFNTATISGAYTYRYPILLDFWNLAREKGRLTLEDTLKLARSFPVDTKYLSKLQSYFLAGELFKGVYGINRVQQAEQIVYLASE